MGRGSLLEGVFFVSDQNHRFEPYGACSLEDLYERLVAPSLDPAIDRWLAEDFGDAGDLTTSAFISPDTTVRAEIRSRQHGVLSGLPIVRRIAARAAGTIETEPLAVDGDRVEPGMRVMEIRGPLSAILPVERTLLNLLGRASGVATATSRFVDAVAGTKAQIVDTRKTTPGLRTIEKYAVRCGGGRLHRVGLHDAVLIKDNHLVGLGDHFAEAVESAAMACREQMRPRFIELEVDDLDQFEAVLDLPSGTLDIVLLDNMDLAGIRKAVARRDQRRRALLLEASGGVTMDSVRAIAETGVDRIAVGAITHSAVQVDFGLDIG
jgi:nicotinate-nucleotide pyrophosphorylase (carboxylating)